MAIKIVLGITAYLLFGTATLAVMKWHDRRVERSFEKWLDDEDDIVENSLTVLFAPFYALLGLFGILPGLIAKGIMILATAAVYTIKVIVKGTEDGDGKGENNR